MFSRIFSYFFSKSPETLSLEEAFKVLEEMDAEPKLKNPEITEDTDLENFSSVQKIGTITNLIDNKFILDDTFECVSTIPDAQIGTKVSYRLYFENGKVNVSNVQLLDNDWNVTENTKRKWCNRSLTCKVVERDGRQLIVNPGDLKIDLNSVASEFVPIVGDWLEVEVKCEIDENVTDLSGVILDICCVRPLRLKQLQGVIKRWDGSTGLINQNVYFKYDSFSIGYIPTVGDKVLAEIIESEQDNYSWRALKIIPIGLKVGNEVDLNFVEGMEGIEIIDDVSLDFTKINETKTFDIKICNKTTQNVLFEKAYFANDNSQCKIKSKPNENTEIEPQTCVEIKCICNCRTFGNSRDLLMIVLDGKKTGRWIQITLQSPNNLNKGSYVYNNKKTPRQTCDGTVVKGQRPTLPPRFAAKKIPEYRVPDKLKDYIFKNINENDSLRLCDDLISIKPCLQKLSYHVYEDFFHTLLYLEELACDVALLNYDMEKTCFIPNGEFLMLEIENLSEKRPSLVVGDKIIARDPYNPNNGEFEGYIHKVGAKHVYLKFAQMFHETYKSEDYSVHVVASRTSFKRRHHAICLGVRNLGNGFIFPTKIVCKEPQIEFVYEKYCDDLKNKDESVVDCSSPDGKSPFSNRNRNILNKLKEVVDKDDSFSKSEVVVEKTDTKLLLPTKEEEQLLKTKKKPQPKDDVPENTPKPKTPPKQLEWFNRNLNYYQREAVRHILLGEARPLPYLIFGPPGTGKTITLVETILQLLKMVPDARILVGTPSNSAADVLALRLIDSGFLKPGDLIRFVAFRCIAENSIPVKLVPYTATADLAREGTHERGFTVMQNGLTLGLNSSIIGRHRVTVGTCSNLGQLFCLNFAKGHFTHIIIDEAGQLIEPDALIPLSFLDTTSGQAILAGDPMQLGPVIISRIAAELGLSESYLERLLCRFPYAKDFVGFPETGGYDPRLVTKLVYNYRSLPEILSLPSKLFYDSQLKPTISEVSSKESELLRKFVEILPIKENNRPASMVFHGVNGENYQTSDSPSWFNPQEASQIFFYYNELIRLGAKVTDIGIISPYAKQIAQIRALFAEAEFEVPKVGTVEEFQGQEFNIILLSTVRSSELLIGSDVKHHLGFIANPRRLNVALTRAQILLVIVGNPLVLSKDAHWRNVLHFCIQNGTYRGFSMSDF